MEKEIKSIKILQGTGENEIEMKVFVTQEEIEKMKEIKSLFPVDWEGNELELLQEAKKQILDNAANKKHNCRQIKKTIFLMCFYSCLFCSPFISMCCIL